MNVREALQNGMSLIDSILDGFDSATQYEDEDAVDAMDFGDEEPNIDSWRDAWDEDDDWEHWGDDLSDDIITINSGDVMAKGRSKGRSGKKQRQKAKTTFGTVTGATPASKTAGAVVAKKPKVWDDDYAGFGFGGYGGVGGYQKCRHYNTNETEGLDIKGVKFFPSSMRNERKDDDLIPDWGLYLDWGWKHPDWHAENIDWRDYGLPTNYQIAFEAMQHAIDLAEKGKKVEIGCIGGHGRTGTALACIGVMLGMEADEAIKHVRKEYCSHTLESDSQEWFVEWVHAKVNNKVCRPKPEPVVKKTTAYSYTPPSHKPLPCGLYDHFYSWLRGAVACNNKAGNGTAVCYYETAKKTFEKGVPNYLLLQNDLEWHRENAKKGGMHPTNPRKARQDAAAASMKARAAAKANSTPGGTVHKPTSTGSTAVFGTRPFVPPLPPAKPKMTVVGDFVVPAPKEGEIQHSDISDPCPCDTCRYIKNGHGAFLEPFDMEDGAKQINEMNALERKAEQNGNVAVIMRAAEEEVTKVHILTPDRGIVEVVVDSNFPKPPTKVAAFNAQREGNYTWDETARVWAYFPLEK